MQFASVVEHLGCSEYDIGNPNEQVAFGQAELEALECMPWLVVGVVQDESDACAQDEPIHDSLPEDFLERYHASRVPMNHNGLIKQLDKVNGKHGQHQ